jgi:hypothetical protein
MKKRFVIPVSPPIHIIANETAGRTIVTDNHVASLQAQEFIDPTATSIRGLRTVDA